MSEQTSAAEQDPGAQVLDFQATEEKSGVRVKPEKPERKRAYRVKAEKLPDHMRVAGSQQHDWFDLDLEWLLVSGSASMRERGTMCAVIASLELGGHAGGVPNTDLYSDSQVGWGRNVVGDVERHRWLMAAWFRLGLETRGHLLACYSSPMAAYRSDQGFGARDHCPPVEVLQRDTRRNTQDKAEPTTGRHQPTRTGVDNRLGALAMLAFSLTDNPAGLLQACRDPGYKKGSRIITQALKQAQWAAEAAHDEWQLVKTGRPRKTRERVTRQPVHTPARADAEVVG